MQFEIPIANYLKAHAAIRVPIYTIEYVMRILSGANCNRNEMQKQFPINIPPQSTSLHN